MSVMSHMAKPFVGLYPVSQNSGPLKLNLFQHRCHHSSFNKGADSVIKQSRTRGIMFRLRMHPN